MKKTLLLWVLLGTLFSAQAQTFSDDFESYADGAKIAASSSDWTTWSGGTASEDAPITTEQAHSGTKSLKFHGVGNGGPSDIILPFGGQKVSGNFELSFWIYVKSDNSAYFNLQATTTPGTTWTEDFLFNADGSLSGTKMPFVGTYSQGQWTQFTLKIDLDHNIWKIYMDDVYQGSYINPVNKIASMDIYPTNGVSDFYIDDVSYTYDSATPVLPALDASLDFITLRPRYLAGTTVALQARVRNVGTDTIHSFDIHYQDDNDTNTKSYTGLSIKPLETYMILLNGDSTDIPAGSMIVQAAVLNVNGAVDTDSTNNIFNGITNATQPAPHRKVLFEEGTGTWCPWCPRGAVYMDRMAARYPDHFVGIAVHSGDPMQVTGYPNGVGFSSYPSFTTDRSGIEDLDNFEHLEGNFFTKIVTNPPAAVFSGGTYDVDSNELTLIAQADFLQDVSVQYKLAVILVEEEVTGTGSGYAQKNNYAGGSNGSMGGYENLPSTVPASQMVYNHVGRKLVSPLGGVVNSLPASASNGESYNYQMPVAKLDTDWDFDKLHVVTLLISPSGKVVNANSQTVAEVLDAVVANNYVEANSDLAQVYPNPMSDQAQIFLSLNEPSEVNLLIFNELGQLVQKVDYGFLAEKTNLNLDVSRLHAGGYTLRINTKNTSITKRIVIQK